MERSQTYHARMVFNDSTQKKFNTLRELKREFKTTLDLFEPTAKNRVMISCVTTMTKVKYITEKYCRYKNCGCVGLAKIFA